MNADRGYNALRQEHYKQYQSVIGTPAMLNVMPLVARRKPGLLFSIAGGNVGICAWQALLAVLRNTDFHLVSWRTMSYPYSVLFVVLHIVRGAGLTKDGDVCWAD